MLHRAAMSPTCSFFGCLRPTAREQGSHGETTMRIGVERQLLVTHGQPQLIEPMKLTIYEGIPATPTAASKQLSVRATETWKSVSRASTRVSISAKKRALLRPRPTRAQTDTPLRRHPSFRPIQLSIYGNSRLSELPEFDSFSFTNEGIIAAPPKALLRSQSDTLLRTYSPVSNPATMDNPASMYEHTPSRPASTLAHTRQNTNSTLSSASRPVSEHNALRSHPVSWYAMPGLPPQMIMAEVPPGRILTPMQEEFSSLPSSAVLIDGRVLAFPEIDAYRIGTDEEHATLLPSSPGNERLAAPPPVLNSAHKRTTVVPKHRQKISQSASILRASSAASTRSRATTPRSLNGEPVPEFPTEMANMRLRTWLDSKSSSRTSSISTIKTSNSSSTSSSFAEHRRKRSQFYQLNQKPAVDTAVTSPVDDASSSNGSLRKTPSPIKVYRPFPIATAVRPHTHTAPSSVTTHSSRPQTATSSRSAKTTPPICPEVVSTQQSIKHTRTATDSTIASTVATDTLFDSPEPPENSRPTVRSRNPDPQNVRDCDVNSMTTYTCSAFNSRSSTIRSTTSMHAFTTKKNVEDNQVYAQEYKSDEPSMSFAASSPILSMSDELSKEISLAINRAQRPQSFDFRGMTPSPVVGTPLSQRIQAEDVERYMHEMCATAGLRRVNVGLAF